MIYTTMSITYNSIIKNNCTVGSLLQSDGTTNLVGATTYGTGGTSYVLPTSRGTNNQILQTNGSGVVTWQTQLQTSKFTHAMLVNEVAATSVSYVGIS